MALSVTSPPFFEGRKMASKDMLEIHLMTQEEIAEAIRKSTEISSGLLSLAHDDRYRDQLRKKREEQERERKKGAEEARKRMRALLDEPFPRTLSRLAPFPRARIDIKWPPVHDSPYPCCDTWRHDYLKSSYGKWP